MAKVMLVFFVALTGCLVICCFLFFMKYRRQMQLLRNANSVAPHAGETKQKQIELVQKYQLLIPTVTFGEKGVD